MNLTLEKGLNVLECLAFRAEPMTLSEITEEVGGNKSTIFRMLETLRKYGYVEQETHRGRYRAGLKVLRLSTNILHRMELLNKAGPYMHTLGDETGCDIYLAADSNGRAIQISAYFPGGRRRTDLGSTGNENKFWYTAMGKCIASFQSPEIINKLFSHTAVVKKTPHTITDRNEILAQFEEIRNSGIAYTRYENSEQIFGIAVPVRNFEGEVIAAIGLAVNKSRIEKEGEERFAEKLKEYGEQLSFALGYASEKLI